jgi:hypothetical protein
MAVMAVGGYGRGEMAPFSDVDLLFVTPWKMTPAIENVIESTLYMLWDLHMKVGHASRTVKECLRLGRQDITIRTSLLEMRFLCGTETVGAELQTSLRKQLFDGTVGEFIEAKLEERGTRHRKQGGQRYMLEPNVKEGKGGLRDLQTLYWIAKYEHGVSRAGDLVDLGVFRPEEFAAFDAAERFLWAVRCHLHLIADRGQDQMTFDIQVQVAERLGYEDHSGRRAVEHFMQDYFRHATRVGELTRIFLTELEARHVKQAPAILGFLRGRTRRKKVKDGYAIKQNRITIAETKAFFADKLNMLRLFEEALRTGYLIHPDAMREVQARLDTIDDAMRRDPEAVPHLPRPAAQARQPRTGAEADERAGRAVGLRARIRPRRRDDAVQHVSQLHGGRAHDTGDLHPRADRARGTDRGTAGRLAHPEERGEPQGSLCRVPAARHRQGPEGGSLHRRRPHRARGLSAPRPETRRMRNGRMAGALSPADVRHGAEARHLRPAHRARLRQGGEDAGAAGTSDGADGLRHPRRGAEHMEQLEGHASARAFPGHGHGARDGARGPQPREAGGRGQDDAARGAPTGPRRTSSPRSTAITGPTGRVSTSPHRSPSPRCCAIWTPTRSASTPDRMSTATRRASVSRWPTIPASSPASQARSASWARTSSMRGPTPPRTASPPPSSGCRTPRATPTRSRACRA